MQQDEDTCKPSKEILVCSWLISACCGRAALFWKKEQVCNTPKRLDPRLLKAWSTAQQLSSINYSKTALDRKQGSNYTVVPHHYFFSVLVKQKIIYLCSE